MISEGAETGVLEAGGRVDRPARVPARRSARRGDHDAACGHRVGGRRHHAGRTARVPRVARPHAVRRLPGRSRQRARAPCARRSCCRRCCAAARFELRTPGARSRSSCPTRCAPSRCSRRSARRTSTSPIVMDEFGAVEGLVTVDRSSRGAGRRAARRRDRGARRVRRARRRIVAGRRVGRHGRSRREVRSAGARRKKPARITRSPAS